jgi:hypothetical protein
MKQREGPLLLLHETYVNCLLPELGFGNAGGCEVRVIADGGAKTSPRRLQGTPSIAFVTRPE